MGPARLRPESAPSPSGALQVQPPLPKICRSSLLSCHPGSAGLASTNATRAPHRGAAAIFYHLGPLWLTEEAADGERA